MAKNIVNALKKKGPLKQLLHMFQNYLHNLISEKYKLVSKRSFNQVSKVIRNRDIILFPQKSGKNMWIPPDFIHDVIVWHYLVFTVNYCCVYNGKHFPSWVLWNMRSNICQFTIVFLFFQFVFKNVQIINFSCEFQSWYYVGVPNKDLCKKWWLWRQA